MTNEEKIEEVAKAGQQVIYYRSFEEMNDLTKEFFRIVAKAMIAKWRV